MKMKKVLCSLVAWCSASSTRSLWTLAEDQNQKSSGSEILVKQKSPGGHSQSLHKKKQKMVSEPTKNQLSKPLKKQIQILK